MWFQRDTFWLNESRKTNHLILKTLSRVLSFTLFSRASFLATTLKSWRAAETIAVTTSYLKWFLVILLYSVKIQYLSSNFYLVFSSRSCCLAFSSFVMSACNSGWFRRKCKVDWTQACRTGAAMSLYLEKTQINLEYGKHWSGAAITCLARNIFQRPLCFIARSDPFSENILESNLTEPILSFVSWDLSLNSNWGRTLKRIRGEIWFSS